jgi:hypothetical protein
MSPLTAKICVGVDDRLTRLMPALGVSGLALSVDEQL